MLTESKNMNRSRTIYLLALQPLLLGGCPVTSPIPNPPAAAPAVDCGLENLPQPGQGPLAVPATSAGGGTFSGESGQVRTAIQLTDGAGGLVIVVDGNLEVLADIAFPIGYAQPGTAAPDITLASISGTLTIGAGVSVGGNFASGGADGNPGANGSNGGQVTLVGINIDVQGSVNGNAGGKGGDSMFDQAGDLDQKAANGGYGGAVVLCAFESIHVGAPPGAAFPASVTGGEGGKGGNTRGDGTSHVITYGGVGGTGADVHVIGTDPGGAPVQLFVDDAVTGGKGGVGGAARADAGQQRGVDSGASALSRGGDGAKGGTVLFRRAVVAAAGTVASGDGGSGGSAIAVAGHGPDAGLFSGAAGGDASAYGGDGMPSGILPQLPTSAGGIGAGVSGAPGSGGTARASAGNGGDGGRLGNGASSGSATASGGLNGRGVPPPAPWPATQAPVGPTGGTGGPGPALQQNGAP